MPLPALKVELEKATVELGFADESTLVEDCN